MPGEFPTIDKAGLFARLAGGHAAGITVVTPNRRLAQVLRAEFDSFQASKKLSVWEDADILPLEAFVARCYEDATYSENAASGAEPLPMLLSPAQARELWVEAIGDSSWGKELLDLPGTADRAMQTWRLAQAWNIAGGLEKFALTEDTRAFAEWARAYARRLKSDGLLDAALLFDFDLKNGIKKPKLLVAYGFEVIAPHALGFLSRFDSLTCSPEQKNASVKKTSYASPAEELESAARWARARLEEGKARIGVVVPDLELRRREVARVFARVMGSPLPFNLSIGQPLGDYPVVACALSLIEFSIRPLPFESVSRLIRSPFLGGAQNEMAARAAFDAALRRKADGTMSLPKLIGAVPPDLLLRSLLENAFNTKAEKQSPHDWAQHFTALLAAAGYPGERTPDSAEYQARAKFNETLGEFSRLSLVISKITGEKAFASLRRLCAETLFQPEGQAGEMRAPVQVLGRLESVGIAFDALWVSGLTDGAWPLRARPDPFLPVALQRKAGIPEAAAETSLAFDRRITEGWARAADEVLFSWARREEDRDLLPSPLIADIPEGKVALPAFPRHRDLLFAARKFEEFEDAKAPGLEVKTVRGGARVLTDQADCPFRAYARHRLRAEALEEPAPGLDDRDRGQLLHALMAGIWGELKSSSALSSELKPTIRKAAAAAVAALGLEGRFADLEVERLARLAIEWLNVERERSEFDVIQIEKKRELSIAGLSLSGRIDRMDRLADGSHALIDYKTGSRVTPKVWEGARPDDPQLPLYAVTSPEKVSAVAFAKLRAGDMKFSGFSEKEKQIPGVKQALSWSGLVEGWKGTLENLATGFAAGEAQVDPKEGLKTCRNCDLHTLCRVHERRISLTGALADADEAGE